MHSNDKALVEHLISMTTGSEYTVDSTVHERREFATSATKFEKFDVTVSMLYTGGAGTVVEMVLYIPGRYQLTIFPFELRVPKGVNGAHLHQAYNYTVFYYSNLYTTLWEHYRILVSKYQHYP